MPGRLLQDTENAIGLFSPFGVRGDDPACSTWKRRYNISPGQTIALVRHANAGPAVAWMKWGLAAAWLKARGSSDTLKFARSEGIATKKSFAETFRSRRCILPITGWYEWPVMDGGKRALRTAHQTSPSGPREHLRAGSRIRRIHLCGRHLRAQQLCRKAASPHGSVHRAGGYRRLA